jgi:hypothetical protein
VADPIDKLVTEARKLYGRLIDTVGGDYHTRREQILAEALSAAYAAGREQGMEDACRAMCLGCAAGWELIPQPEEYKTWQAVHRGRLGIPVICSASAIRRAKEAGSPDPAQRGTR